MSRFLSALVLALVLASCGGGSKAPPRDPDNACNILSERRDYRKAFTVTQRRWNVPIHVQMSTIYHESRYRGDARTPFNFVLGVIPMGRQSSAYGYSQAIDGTWDQYRKATGRRGARRDRINDATDFVGWYMNETRNRNGIALTDARNQYLAYHEGHTGFARGSYNQKSWLLRVADDVQKRANMYEVQLNSCRRLW